MKKMFNKMVASFLLGVMGISMVSECFATSSAVYTKEEIIYANLSNDGSVKSLYAVNAFDVTQAGVIEDYGIYTEVKNLSSTSELKKEEDYISVEAERGRFYYQGNMETKELPWKIAILYYLDGKEIKAEDLLGKSGNLEIKLDFTRNEKVDASFFENYSVQGNVTLNTEKCENIEAEGATVANVGKNKQLTYMLLPKTEKEFVIKTNVKDFEMDPISINIIPLALDIESPDTSEFTDQINNLQTAIKDLNTGANSLKNGISTLNTGAQSLEKGLKEVKTGASSLNSGIKQLDKGTQSLEAGSQELKKGLKTLTQNSTTLKNSSSEIQKGIKTLATAANTPNQEMAKQVKELKTQIATLEAAIKTLPEGETKTNLQAIEKKLSTQLDALLKSVETTTKTLGGTLNTLQEKYKEFDTGLNTYINGVDSVQEGFDGVTEGIETVRKGIKTLDTGADKLSVGASKLYDGGTSLAQGTNELLSGSSKLAEGTEKMKKETSGMDKKITDTVDDMISEYLGGDFETKSYVSEKNEEVKAVQFVLRTDGITEEEKEEEVVVEETNEKTGFWDKMMALFKK